MKTTTLFILTGLLSLNYMVTWGISAEKNTHYEHEFNVETGGRLYLDSDLGSLTITTHDSNRVMVKIELSSKKLSTRKAREQLEDFEISADGEGKNVRIIGKWKSRKWRKRSNLRVEYKVAVPHHYHLV